MKRTNPLILALLLAFLLPALTGCVSRTRRVEPRLSSAQLQEATLPELIEQINRDAKKIQTLNATVDIATSVGGEKKGKVTEYQEVRGYVLMRKPEDLRMVGLVPVVRNRLFDMVSDGEQFRLSIPPRNRFIVGANEVVKPSKQPLENLRPQHIMDALLLHEIDPQQEIAVLEAGSEEVRDAKNKKDVEQATYEVVVIRRDADEGAWKLSRRIIFSRADLLPHRQIVYDDVGNIATIAHYENFAEVDGVRFPHLIEITRPKEEYTIQLSVVKLRINVPMNDEQFALTQPPGAELVRIGEKTVVEDEERPPAQRASDGQSQPRK